MTIWGNYGIKQIDFANVVQKEKDMPQPAKVENKIYKIIRG